jgi:hypothetical protein
VAARRPCIFTSSLAGIPRWVRFFFFAYLRVALVRALGT